MQNPSSKRILITEEALRNRDGHWFEYNRATKAALVEYDPSIQVQMLGHVSMEPEVARELDAIPHYRFTVWDQIYNQPQAWKRYYGIWLHNARLQHDLSRFLASNQPYGLVFAPTVVLHHLLAYHHIAKRFAGKKLGQLVLLMRNNIAVYDSDGHRTFRSTARFWRLAIRRFEPFLKTGTVRFVTDSERLADEYEELTGFRFEVIPHPSLVAHSNAHVKTQQHNESDSIRLFLPGPSRYEKGTDRLIEALNLFSLQRHAGSRRLKVVLQWATPFPLPDNKMVGPDDFEQVHHENFELEILRQPLSSEDYQMQLERADGIILPYRRETYFARISGVAVEAMLLSKPLFYTSDTWVGSIAEQFGVGTPMPDSVQGVCDTLVQLESILEEAKKRAAANASRVREFFSVGQFARALLGIARP